MTMLAILISYALERFLNNIDHYRTYLWFNNFVYWTRSRFEGKALWNDTLAVLALFLIPVFVVAYIHGVLADISISFEFIFSVAILLYCFGPVDLHEAARLFIEDRQHDDQTRAKEHATTILGEHLPDNDSQLFKDIGNAVLVATNERLLAVFFWFVILGPLGAVLYRLSSVLMRNLQAEQQQGGNSIGLLHTTRLFFAILNWVPAHLTALCYGVIGSFIDALHEWKKYHVFDPFNPDECNTMLIKTGLGSLRMDSDSISFDQSGIKHILEMSWRTTLVWLTVLALMTMAGWAV